MRFFFDVIQSTLETIAEEYEEKADVMAVPTRGILVTMETFTFLFGIIIFRNYRCPKHAGPCRKNR
jgi:hypothetical protein